MIDQRDDEWEEERQAQSSAMMTALRDGVVRLLLRAVRFWWAVLPVFLLLAAFGAFRLSQIVPQLDYDPQRPANSLTVVVRSDSEASARRIVEWMTSHLRGHQELVVTGDSLPPTELSGRVLWPLGDDLEAGAERVIGLQPLLARLTATSGSVSGSAFVRSLADLLADPALPEPVGLIPAMAAFAGALDLDARGTVSWPGLIRGQSKREAGFAALYLEVNADAGAAVELVRGTMAEARQRFAGSLRLTGDALWKLQETELGERHLWASAVMVLLGFALIALFAVHDWRMVTVMLGVLAVWAVAQGAWLTTGDFSGVGGIIGLVFSALLLQVVVFDLFDRYRDEHAARRDSALAASAALSERIGAFGLAYLLVLAALPLFAFFAYGSLAAFARTALYSSAMAALVVFLLLPACLPLLGSSRSRDRVSPMRLLWAGVAGLSFSFGGVVKIVAVLLVILGVLMAPLFTPAISTSERLGNLPSVRTHDDLVNLGIGSPWNIQGSVGDERTAASLAGRLEKHPQVKQVIWAGALISQVGTRGRATLTDLQVIMGINQRGSEGGIQLATDAFDGQAWSDLRTALLRIQSEGSEADPFVRNATALLDRMTVFEARAAAGSETRSAAWAALENRLLGGFPEFWTDLRREIVEAPPSRREAADALEGVWVSRAGGYRVEVVPAFDANDMAARSDFVRHLRANLPKKRGELLQEYELRETIVAMMVKSIGAALAVTLLLSLLFSCKRGAGVAIVLFGVAAMFMPAGLAGLNGWPVGSNWIAVFPALGLLVISTGAMALHRIVRYQPAMGNLLLSSTGRAAIMAWTAVLVIGLSFWASAHPAVSGLGSVLVTASLIGPFLALVVISSAFAPDYSVAEQ